MLKKMTHVHAVSNCILCSSKHSLEERAEMYTSYVLLNCELRTITCGNSNKQPNSMSDWFAWSQIEQTNDRDPSLGDNGKIRKDLKVFSTDVATFISQQHCNNCWPVENEKVPQSLTKSGLTIIRTNANALA